MDEAQNGVFSGGGGETTWTTKKTLFHKMKNVKNKKMVWGRKVVSGHGGRLIKKIVLCVEHPLWNLCLGLERGFQLDASGSVKVNHPITILTSGLVVLMMNLWSGVIIPPHDEHLIWSYNPSSWWTSDLELYPLLTMNVWFGVISLLMMNLWSGVISLLIMYLWSGVISFFMMNLWSGVIYLLMMNL